MSFSWPNRAKLLASTEVVLWFLLLFSLPIQRRIIVYQSTWYFQEWLSFALYGTDILLAILLMVSLIRSWRAILTGEVYRHEYFLGAFLLLGGISIFYSSDPTIGIFAMARILEFVAFYWYVSRYALKHFRAVYSALALVAGIVLQAVIAIVQSVLQHDLGLRLLGESVLGPHIQGVASFYISSGEKIMRAYGTTPHPNVLAAFLLVGLVSVCVLFLRQPVNRLRLVAFLSAYGLLWWALVVTFSRTIIGLWGLIVLLGFFVLWRLRKNYARTGTIIIIATIVFAAVLTVAYWPEIISRVTVSGQEEAVQLRWYYSGQALESGGSIINWFGIGIGNFVGWLMHHQPNLSLYLYQPVHNIYLLLYTETGFLGLALWLAFIVGTFLRLLPLRTLSGWSWPVIITAIAILAIGLLDHFPWTLQQGRFLLWGALAAVSFCARHRGTISLGS